MSHRDIAYCADNIGCPYKYNCKRSQDNPSFNVGENELITLSNFPHTETNCDYYLK